MDNEFLQKLGIKDTVPSIELINQLEEKQLEYLERIENATDNKRKIELHQDLQKIEKSIEVAKQAISAVSMGIALDDAGDTKEPEIQEVVNDEAEKKAEKKAKIKEEVEVLKQKPAQNAEQASDSGQDQTSKSNQSSNSGDSMSDGLKAYKAGNFSKAFTIFKNFSEAKNAKAQLLLAIMYEKGEGTNQDKERSKFWYKTSAEAGNADAQYAYSILRKEDSAPFKEIMSWLELACEQKHRKALELYVDSMIKEDHNNYTNHIVSNASRYCDYLIELENDSFSIANYQKMKKLISKFPVMDKVYNIGRLFEKVIVLIGLLYAYMGSREAETFGFHILKAPVIPIKWNFLDEFLHGFFNSNGIFGLLLLFIGAFIGGIICMYRYLAINTKYTNMLGSLVSYAIWGVCIWQFARIFVDHMKWTRQIGIIIIIGAILYVGSELGFKIPRLKIKKEL